MLPMEFLSAGGSRIVRPCAERPAKRNTEIKKVVVRLDLHSTTIFGRKFFDLNWNDIVENENQSQVEVRTAKRREVCFFLSSTFGCHRRTMVAVRENTPNETKLMRNITVGRMMLDRMKTTISRVERTHSGRSVPNKGSVTP